MIWQPATLKLFTLSCDQPTVQLSQHDQEFNSFTGTGTGFDEEDTQLVFVRADVTDGSLKPFQVIPCSELKIKEAGNEQQIKFKASLFQRDKGPYHLVAWNPTATDGLNEATVLEWSMAVRVHDDQLNIQVHPR